MSKQTFPKVNEKSISKTAFDKLQFPAKTSSKNSFKIILDHIISAQLSSWCVDDNTITFKLKKWLDFWKIENKLISL